MTVLCLIWSSFALAAVPSVSSSTRVASGEPRCTVAPGAQQAIGRAAAGGRGGAVTPPVKPRTVKLWVKWGHGRWCRGVGVCFIDGNRPDSGPHCRGCSAVVVAHSGDGTVTIESASAPGGERSGLFYVDKDLPLPDWAANRLGAGAITISAGHYTPTWSDSGVVQVTLNVRRG